MKTTVARLTIVLLAASCGQPGANGPEPQAAEVEPSPPPTSPTPETRPAPAPSPAPATGFVRFLLIGDEAGCPPQAHGDCHSSAELLADRTLKLDAWGDPGGGVRTASVPEDAFAAAVQRLTAPDVVGALSTARACAGADQTESMTLRVGADEHRATTGACNDAPIQAARGTTIDLCSRLFPDHSLISPPF